MRAPELLDFPGPRPIPGLTPARELYLRENAAVDHHVLAAAMGLSARFVYNCLRRLGLRRLTSASDRRKNRFA